MSKDQRSDVALILRIDLFLKTIEKLCGTDFVITVKRHISHLFQGQVWQITSREHPINKAKLNSVFANFSLIFVLFCLELGLFGPNPVTHARQNNVRVNYLAIVLFSGWIGDSLALSLFLQELDNRNIVYVPH
jgi:hypothetical protein